nr:hypothetical protein HmN_000620500 [Hymenolepis microstoma]
MPRPKKKPTWWRDPDTQAVVRRGLLYLIRNIYGEIPSSVKVRLKHKAENASYQDQNNKEESTRMRSNSEVEYCGACQEIYGKVDDNSEDLSTSDTCPHTKTITEEEISEISKGDILGESVQDGSEISYFNDRECLIKLLQQLYPEVANCLRQADHTSSVYLEDLCACLLAIYEAIETPDTEDDLKCCLMHFIEQLYPDLISYIAKNTLNESVPMEEIEEEVVNENKAKDMVNDECKQNIFGDHVDEIGQVGECSIESTTEELTSELTTTNDVETEDSHNNLDECLTELTQRICDELPNCVDGYALELTESSEECDYEEEEELLDTSEEEVVEDYATYVAVAECFRNCLVELIPKLWPEKTNCSNQSGDQTCQPTTCISTKTPKVERHVSTCLPQPCPESPCCIKQYQKDHNSRKEENKEKYEIKCAQVVKESTCNVADKSHNNDNGEMELDEAFLVKCVLQLIQQLCPELIDGDVKRAKSKGEICKESVHRECCNKGRFAVADKQKYERVQSETDLDGLNKCFAQLLQYLDNEIAISADKPKNAKSVECKIKETESTKNNFAKCRPCGEEIPTELIEEILVKCFLILVKQMYPEMVCCIMHSSGPKIDTDLKETMGVGTKQEVPKLREKEQNICGKHPDKLISNKECGKKSQWTEESLRKCLLEYVQQLIQELDNCTKETAGKTLTTVARTTYEKCGKENNDPAAEWNREDIKELLALVQKLCPELAECIRGCESDQIPGSDHCDEEESTLSENDLIESLFEFMDQTNPKLYSCSDGSDTETECDEETIRNCFLKFVEELYPDLANYTKQSLMETPETAAEINKADKECEMPQKVTQDVRKCESMVTDENKTECIDNSVGECLVQFIQQISPELADCIEKYNDSNSAEADISDVSILEVSEALEASLSDVDIKGCLLKLINLLCPDLAKNIQESDNSCKPCEPERNFVDISEGSESASIEDSLRDSFISFIEEAYPELVDCIEHIKKVTNDDCNDGNESEIDKDETTIDESIFDEVKTEETMNENNCEESQVEVLTSFEQCENELDHFDDEEKSEMTITPDQFTEDVQPESGEPDCRKNFDVEYEITVSYDADDNTEAQSLNLSPELSSSECIHPLTSINEAQIDDEENLSSEDIFKDCFLRVLEQFDSDLACCIMENLPENSSPQIEDSNESGDVISEQPNESQDCSENPSKVKFGLFEENTFMSDENITNEETSNPEYPMESQEIVEKTDDLVTDENFSMVSEVALVVNEDASIEEGSALTEELSAAKIGELLNPGVLSSDFSQVEPSTNQNITISDTDIQYEDERQATQQIFCDEISLGVKDSDINTKEREEEEGTLFDSIFDEIVYATDREESKCDKDSEMIRKVEEGESITEESGDVMVEKCVPLSEYEESDENVESPVVEENTGSEAEINERLYHEWIKCTSEMDIEPVKMNGDEDNEAKDMSSMEDGGTESMESETSEGNCGEWDELRVCLLAIADEFYPELANCIRKCLVEEEKGGMASDFETDRRNMQLCLEKFAAKFYAKPTLKPEQDDSIPGVKNVEEIYTPTVKYIQQLILDFAQIFHPELAHSLQQQ